MAIIYDPAKRDRALLERGVDFSRCSEIFAGKHITFEDERKDYGEPRFITIARLDSRMLVIVWTPRDGHERIISMRRANDREQRDYQGDLDRRG